jgi:hypothetical protein
VSRGDRFEGYDRRDAVGREVRRLAEQIGDSSDAQIKMQMQLERLVSDAESEEATRARQSRNHR